MKYCRICGAEVLEDKKFCAACGGALNDSPQTASYAEENELDAAIRECSEIASKIHSLAKRWLDLVEILPKHQTYENGIGILHGRFVVLFILVGFIGFAFGASLGGAWFILTTPIGAVVGLILAFMYGGWEVLVKNPKFPKNEMGKIRKAEFDLTREIDTLILNDWNPKKQRADVIAAVKFGEIGLYPENYEKIRAADEFLQSITRKAQIKVGMWRQLNDSKKLAVGVATVGAIAGVATVVAVKTLAEPGMRDFGRQSARGDRWINKETGEVFDYDPR